MNQNHMAQIFAHYIDKFEYLNTGDHIEYYKWQTCKLFKPLMDKALATDDDNFSEALYEVKKITYNIIDSFTQPFYGLVKFAEKEPATVKQMFTDLYAPDNGDLDLQMKKISAFFDKSNELLDKYYPGSHLYKQNSHSVSAYLFLYDPDHHYMYKYAQSTVMADCIEFYDDWGGGDNINLHVYYRMCDQILAEIKACPEVVSTHRSRYEGAYGIDGASLHDDSELHILLFDIIWCCHIYDLFDGISFNRPKAREKKLLIEEKNKADQLYESYLQARTKNDKLEEALEYLATAVTPGDKVIHRVMGEMTVEKIDHRYIYLAKIDSEKVSKLGLTVVISNGIVKYTTPEFEDKKAEYLEYLKKADLIPKNLDYAIKAMEPYRGILGLDDND